MQIAQDKFNETKYHFWRLKEQMDSVLNETDLSIIFDEILKFRYEINSYVNSHRATTFALQSEHKSKLGNKFISWYENARKYLQEDEFSKILQELRNINQKEGNIYPTFEFKGESKESIIYFEIDFTNEANGFIVNKRQYAKKSFTIELSKVLPGEDPGTITPGDRRNMLFAAAKFYGEQEAKIIMEKKFKLDKLKIERFEKEYSPEDFIENLKRMGKKLQDIIDDGWKELNLP